MWERALWGQWKAPGEPKSYSPRVETPGLKPLGCILFLPVTRVMALSYSHPLGLSFLFWPEMEGRASYYRAPGWANCRSDFICRWTSPFLEKATFHFNPKERQHQRLFKLPLCSFRTLQDNAQNPSSQTQQYVNWELPDAQAGFRKGRGTRDQIANIHWIIEKAREFQEIIYFHFINYTKAFDSVDHNKLWKILKDMGITDLLTASPFFAGS